MKPDPFRSFRPTLHALALASALAVSALSPLSATAEPLRWGAQNDILTMDPHSQNHATTNAIMMHTYEGLTRYDKDYKVGAARSVVMIQCVGSRSFERPYCSRYCCPDSPGSR